MPPGDSLQPHLYQVLLCRHCSTGRHGCQRGAGNLGRSRPIRRGEEKGKFLYILGFFLPVQCDIMPSLFRITLSRRRVGRDHIERMNMVWDCLPGCLAPARTGR